jgi:hypothetical protein
MEIDWTGMKVVGLSSDDSQKVSVGHTDQMIVVHFIAQNVIIGESIRAINGIRIEIQTG